MFERGQVITLDMVIALIIIVFAIAYMVQIVEMQQNSAIGELSYSRIKNNTVNAGNLLVGNPNIQCHLTDANGTIMPLPGTVKDEPIDKNELGLTDAYGCNIQGITTNCNDLLPADTKNIFVEKRKVLICSATALPGTITTGELKQARATNDFSGIGSEREVTITLWK